jgi:hypothetical protein
MDWRRCFDTAFFALLDHPGRRVVQREAIPLDGHDDAIIGVMVVVLNDVGDASRPAADASPCIGYGIRQRFQTLTHTRKLQQAPKGLVQLVSSTHRATFQGTM